MRTLPLKSQAPFSFMGALKEIALYAGIFLSALVLFLTIKPLYGFERNGVVAQAIEAAAIGACLFVGGFLAFNKKLTAQRLVLLLFIMGVALRMGYIALYARQYPVSTIPLPRISTGTKRMRGRSFRRENFRQRISINFIILLSTLCCRRDSCTLCPG